MVAALETLAVNEHDMLLAEVIFRDLHVLPASLDVVSQRQLLVCMKDF